MDNNKEKNKKHSFAGTAVLMGVIIGLSKLLPKKLKKKFGQSSKLSKVRAESLPRLKKVIRKTKSPKFWMLALRRRRLAKTESSATICMPI